MPSLTIPTTDAPAVPVSGAPQRRRSAGTAPRRGRHRATLCWLAVIVLALLVGAGTAVAAPPANDDFPGRTLGGDDNLIQASNVGATGQAGEPHIAGSTPDTTIWYSWTAGEDGPATISLASARFDTALEVFVGNSIGSLTSVAWNDTYLGSQQSKLTFTASAGTVYRIAVDGFFAQSGAFVLQLAQRPPANDDFAAARTLPGPTGKQWDTNRRATSEPGESPDPWPSKSVWYAWVAPQTGTAVFNTRQATFDTTLAAYTGPNVTALTKLASNNDANGSVGAQVKFPVVSGTTYRIAVDGYAYATGAFALQWSLNPPANDDFANAHILAGQAGNVASTNVRSTGEPAEVDNNRNGEHTVWFRWTPAATGPAVVRVTSPDGLSPLFDVYTGTRLDALTRKAEGSTSATFSAVAGTEYRIAVEGGSGSTAPFTLQYVLGVCHGLAATIMSTGTSTGTAGNDVIVGTPGNDTLDGGAGSDTICGIEGDDSLTGGAGNDSVYGGPGSDRLREGTTSSGADQLVGEAGTDTVSYEARSTPVKVSLDGVANDGTTGEGDDADAEDVSGGSADDTIVGNGGENRLAGGAGADVLKGDSGADVLVAGAGADSVFGGGGTDDLSLADGVAGNDTGDGGAGTDTATKDAGDTVVNVP